MDSEITIFLDLIRSEKLPIHIRDFEFSLKSHPDYPAIKSVSDTLDQYGIENAPVKLRPTDFNEIEDPFLAYVRIQGAQTLVFVKSVEELGVVYSDGKRKNIKIPLESFIKEFTGYAILVNLKLVQEIPANEAKKKERRLTSVLSGAFLVLLMLLLANGLYLNSTSLFQDNATTFFFTFMAVGSLISGALYFKDVAHNDSLFNKVCTIGKSVDCESVLQSKHATIYGWIKWSDLGLIYFLGGLFSLAFGFSLAVIQLLAVLALPYVFVSLYQQAFVIKKWCLFCLGIVSVLLINGLYALSLGSISNINITDFIEVSLMYLSVGLICLLYKNWKRTNSSLFIQEIIYTRIKNTKEVFTSLIKREKKLIGDSDDENYLFFEAKSGLDVTVFLSLNCAHCARLFDEVKGFYEAKSINLQIVLVPTKKDTKQAAILSEVYQTYMGKGEQSTIDVMTSWFERKYKVPQDWGLEDLSSQEGLFVQKQVNFAKQNQVSEFPATFIQGYKKSNYYSLQEYLELGDILEPVTSEQTKEKMII